MEQKIKQDFCIGTNIRELRMKAGLTQEQVAAKLQIESIDMSRDFYAHIESGAYNIRVSELAALRRIFRCSYNDFFKGF
ncbi:MAG TPA: helix-turn-helix transcriptional regulator [Anaerovoracaceae bacterium]|nr:helix-turn-helix transcriptional regulator [Anaerovoracaceae bacterium]